MLHQTDSDGDGVGDAGGSTQRNAGKRRQTGKSLVKKLVGRIPAIDSSSETDSDSGKPRSPLASSVGRRGAKGAGSSKTSAFIPSPIAAAPPRRFSSPEPMHANPGASSDSSESDDVMYLASTPARQERGRTANKDRATAGASGLSRAAAGSVSQPNMSSFDVHVNVSSDESLFDEVYNDADLSAVTTPVLTSGCSVSSASPVLHPPGWRNDGARMQDSSSSDDHDHAIEAVVQRRPPSALVGYSLNSDVEEVSGLEQTPNHAARQSEGPSDEDVLAGWGLTSSASSAASHFDDEAVNAAPPAAAARARRPKSSPNHRLKRRGSTPRRPGRRRLRTASGAQPVDSPSAGPSGVEPPVRRRANSSNTTTPPRAGAYVWNSFCWVLHTYFIVSVPWDLRCCGYGTEEHWLIYNREEEVVLHNNTLLAILYLIFPSEVAILSKFFASPLADSPLLKVNGLLHAFLSHGPLTLRFVHFEQNWYFWGSTKTAVLLILLYIGSQFLSVFQNPRGID